MSPEAQRIAIAEACRWTWAEEEYTLYGFTCAMAMTRKRWTPPKGGKTTLDAPDYLNDLNAMHEATQSLTKDQLRWYRNLLIEMTGTFEAIDATAAERAEAFLRTIGKWEYEAKP